MTGSVTDWTLDGRDRAVQVVQFHLDIAGDVDFELKRLVGRCGRDGDPVVAHRVHVQLVGGIAGNPQA